MSTEKRAATKRLSSEGTGTGTNTANLEQHERQHEEEISSTATIPTQQPTDATTGAGAIHQGDSSPVTPIATGAERTLPPVAEAEGSEHGESPRQVIAVSASKSPAAFFNLARKFLVTNEMCDLSALEGAIVSAVDAAHLLERSQLATIVGIHTSYVSVEPKRKKQSSSPAEQGTLLPQPTQATPRGPAVGEGEVATLPSASNPPAADEGNRARGDEAEGSTQSTPTAAGADQLQTSTALHSSRRGSSGGRELRRARIVVTVRRTESYKRWLEENPLQAIIASEGDEDAEEPMETPPPTGKPKAP